MHAAYAGLSMQQEANVHVLQLQHTLKPKLSYAPGAETPCRNTSGCCMDSHFLQRSS